MEGSPVSSVNNGVRYRRAKTHASILHQQPTISPPTKVGFTQEGGAEDDLRSEAEEYHQLHQIRNRKTLRLLTETPPLAHHYGDDCADGGIMFDGEEAYANGQDKPHAFEDQLSSENNVPLLLQSTWGRDHSLHEAQPHSGHSPSGGKQPASGVPPAASSSSKAPGTKARPLGLFEFVWLEITRGYSLQNDHDRYAEKRRKVYAFMRIPLELEKFLFYGVLQCLDAFCHVFTFLPIRILMAVVGWLARAKVWTAANTCDLLKVAIILISSCFMHYVDTSKVYHQVRGQGVIKLYIFYNMLEVADKLFSSFGQDIFDALLWTASERGRSLGGRFLSTLLHLAIAVVYATCHAVLVLLQATTLNVAFNSHNQSLLTIMMSNNFVELKGAVFKKFAKPNLFQMSCSDVRERFHTVILLVVVVLRNMTAVNWKLEHLNDMLPDLIMVVVAELLVDWLKHAFITKFNEINSEVYKDFTITLAFDVVRSHERDAYTDFSDQVSRRMGFIPIPLTIMLLRVCTQSIDFHTHQAYIYAFAALWVAMLVVKVLNGLFLHAKAVEQVNHYNELQARAEAYELYRRRMLAAKKSKSVPNSPRLSLVDFTADFIPDVLAQAIRNTPKGYTASDLLANWEEMASPFRHRELSGSKSGLVGIDSPSAAAAGNVAGGAAAPVGGAEQQPRRTMSLVDFNESQRHHGDSDGGEKGDAGVETRENCGAASPSEEREARTAAVDGGGGGEEESSSGSPSRRPARARQVSSSHQGGEASAASQAGAGGSQLFTEVQAFTMIEPSEGGVAQEIQ